MSAPEPTPSSEAPTAGVVPPERCPPCSAHPKQRAASTCRGCGLFLCAECLEGLKDATCARCGAEGHPIPWEDPKRGRVKALFATLGGMLKANAFFSAMPWTGGLKGPLYFAVLASFLGALVKTVFGLISSAMMGGAMGAALQPILQNPQLRRGLPPEVRELLTKLPELMEGLGRVMLQMELSMLLLNPVSTALGVLVLAALSHPIARWLGGQGSFEATFRVIAYAGGANILQAIPGFGATLAFLGGIALVVVGSQRAHGISTARGLVVALWWFPFAFLAGLLLVAWLAWLALRLIQGG